MGVIKGLGHTRKSALSDVLSMHMIEPMTPQRMKIVFINGIKDRGEDSVSKAVSSQAQGPEFEPQNSPFKCWVWWHAVISVLGGGKVDRWSLQVSQLSLA